MMASILFVNVHAGCLIVVHVLYVVEKCWLQVLCCGGLLLSVSTKQIIVLLGKAYLVVSKAVLLLG